MPRTNLRQKHITFDPSRPLSPKREAFCLSICDGHRVVYAHQSAGFEGRSEAAAFQLRRDAEIDARITWMLQQRVEAHNRGFARRQNQKGDLLERVVKRLEAIAMTDLAEIADWRTEAFVDEKGETQVKQRLRVKDANAISPAARAAIKGAFLKSGEIRLEMHDQRAALESLAKILKGDDVATSNNITVNQVNVGQVSATDAAQRIAFLLAAAANRMPSTPLLDVTPVHNSKVTDTEGEC